MTVGQAITLLLVAVVGGAQNSVAGGGSFLTVPALIFTGVPPVNANTTSTVALWPGSVASVGAYRRELTTQRRELVLLSIVSLVGGLLGAVLLLHTSQKAFVHLLPYLLLAATLLFTFGPVITQRLRARFSRPSAPADPKAADKTAAEPASWPALASVAVLQLIISIYGGYFGGGIGILMLAGLGLMGMTNIHSMNALKTVLASLINGVAVVAFIAAHSIYWPQAIVMVVGAIVGGYGGAAIARQLDPRLIRGFVIVVGFAMTIYFFVRPS